MKCLILMKSLCFFGIVFLSLAETQIAHAQTDIPEGDVSGTWTLVNAPYHINGEIAVPDGETLTIEPGVDVAFTGHYKFDVHGRLLAIGTEQDTITFTAENSDTGWHGIKLGDISSANDSTIFEHCIFQHGKANTGSGFVNRCGGAIYSNLNSVCP